MVFRNAAIYICDACRESFSSKCAVLQHMRTCVDPKEQIGEQPAATAGFECSTCRLNFEDLHSRNLHNMKVHAPTKLNHEDKKFRCNALNCYFASSFLVTLEYHKLHAHKILACRLCGKVLKNDVSERSHLKRHESPLDGVFKCLYQGCNQTFLECDFKEHTEQHYKAKKSECGDCGKFLSTKPRLASHRKKHTKVKSGHLNCVYGECRTLFSNSTELKLHMADHKKVRPKYSCTKCSKLFPSTFSLEQHEKLHLIVKNSVQNSTALNSKSATPKKSTGTVFLCQYCGCGFSSLSKINLHLRKHETETPGVVKCLRKYCKKRFFSVSELQEHSDVHKQEKFKCNECCKFVETIREMRQHMLRHLEQRSFCR